MIARLNNGTGYKRDDTGDFILDENSRPVEVNLLSAESITAMNTFDDPRLGPIPPPIKPAAITGLIKMKAYGLGWYRTNLGGRYWNYPWNPAVDPDMGVNWEELALGGIMRNEIYQENGENKGGGLDVEGHGGDMPGYHAGMFRITDRLAMIYLLNGNWYYSEEYREEHLMQPTKFMLYTTIHDGADELYFYNSVNDAYMNWALPHNIVKISELQHLLVQKAANLE